MTDQLTLQTVFMVFYAIFWGAIFNVLPRRKPFDWPLAFQRFQHGYRKAWKRVWLSVALLNILPLIFFGYVMWALNGQAPPDHPLLLRITVIVVRGVVPAFAILGIYRIWLGITEWWPHCFYPELSNEVPEPYRHVEPVYRWGWDEALGNRPFVEVAHGAGRLNVVVGTCYVVVAGLCASGGMPMKWWSFAGEVLGVASSLFLLWVFSLPHGTSTGELSDYEKRVRRFKWVARIGFGALALSFAIQAVVTLSSSVYQ